MADYHKIILHGSRRSPFVEKVYRGLMLKRLPFEIHEPHTLQDVRRNNPTTGKMPALELDGQLLFDSTFILRALDDYQPSPLLLSADPLLAAQQRLIEDWADESLYWYGLALRWAIPANAKRALQTFVSAAPPLLRPVVKIMAPRLMRSQIRAQGTGRLPAQTLVRELDGHLAALVKMLGRGPFFFGLDQPSVADLAVYGQLFFLHDSITPEGQETVENHPALTKLCLRLDVLTG